MDKLDKKYASSGLVILAFPCNQFDGQEPNTAADAEKNTKEMYGMKNVRFMEKVDVNGDDTHPVLDFLKEATPFSLGSSHDVEWNFEKFLVNRRGQMYKRYPSNLDMVGSPIERDIKALLAVPEPEF